MRSLFLTLAYLAFFMLGAAAPFALTLGYLWVDTLRPQEIAYAILNQLPISMMIGAAAIGSYLVLDRRAPPRLNATIVLTLVYALWVTLTTTWAVAPEAAWRKWDWAFKTMVFSAFVQYAIRSRIQIEAFLQVYLWTLAANFLPAAAKTAMGHGGYGVVLGLSVESNITESSIFAAICLVNLPILYFLRTHSRILPRSRFSDLVFAGLALCIVVAVVGTYARTGLVGMLVVGAGIWLRSRHKLLFGFAGLAVAAGVALLASQSWSERMATINEYNTEGSALGRILAWRWTLDFLSQHPLGGGFESYLINQIEIAGKNGELHITKGKAFHSVYFEALGEHGYVGFGLLLALIVITLLTLQSVSRRTRGNPDLLWCRDLAFALQVALITLLVCGSFVSIGFLPPLWYLFALSAALKQYVVRSARSSPQAGWRALAARSPQVITQAARKPVLTARAVPAAGRPAP